jgi:fumarate reductase subunit D
VTEDPVSSQQILEGKIFALLSYLAILCIIPLVIKRDNPFVLAHGKQGLVLFVGEVAVFVASIILPMILIKLVCFLFGLLSLWGIVESLRGNFIRMPVVSEIADKIIL